MNPYLSVPSGRTPTPAAVLAASVFFLLSLPVAATSKPDLAAGQESYAKCIGCHSPSYNRTGPLHCGIVGREAASVEGYNYSQAMREARIVWDADTLDRFLTAPLTMLPGTSMGFAGIPDAEERRNLIAWLASLDASSDACRDVLPLKPGNE